MPTTTKRMSDPQGNIYEVDLDEDESDETKEPDEMLELAKDLTWLRKQRQLAEAQSNGKIKTSKTVRRLALGKRSDGRG